MADENEIYPPKPKTQQLPEANQPSKFYSHFLYKAAFFTVFIVLIPLFPTEIINQSQNARSWELLQLIFVGIAVSYGLFSKKNDDDDGGDAVEKDHHVSKIDNAESYVSKLLQVSSVFDDESENDTVIDENKVQTWNSKYYRGEPVVVVAKESANVKESSGVSLAISQKPLLLPVRSLKQRVPGQDEVDLANDSGGRSTFTRSGSSSGSKRFSSNLSIPKNGDFGGRSSEKLEEKTQDNIVLRSPIPWRSRSGRMEVEGNGDSPEFKLETRSVNPKAGKLEVEPNGDSPEFRSETRIPKSGSGVEVEENGDGPEFRSGMRSLRQRSGRMEVEENEDIPDLRSGMRSIRQRSGRMEVEGNEDGPDLRSGMRSIRQRSGRMEVEVNGDSPEFRLETVSLRQRSGRMEGEGNGDSPEFRSETRSLKPNRSFKNLPPPQSLSSPKKLSNQASFPLEPQAKSSEDVVRKKRYSTPPPPPPPPPFPRKDTRKSISSITNSSVSSHKEFKRSVKSVPMDELSDSEIDENASKVYPGSESRGGLLHGGLPKSVRTFRSNEPEVEQRRKSVDYDIRFSKEQSNELFEKVLVETSDDDDSEIDNELDKLVRSPGKAEEAANGDEANEPGPDVDKKADEFIAKFREQIRLQRVNSFRRSAADRSLKT